MAAVPGNNLGSIARKCYHRSLFLQVFLLRLPTLRPLLFRNSSRHHDERHVTERVFILFPLREHSRQFLGLKWVVIGGGVLDLGDGPGAHALGVGWQLVMGWVVCMRCALPNRVL